jgi:hypothetical protein
MQANVYCCFGGGWPAASVAVGGVAGGASPGAGIGAGASPAMSRAWLAQWPAQRWRDVREQLDLLDHHRLQGRIFLERRHGAGGRDADAVDDFHALGDAAEHGVSPAGGQGSSAESLSATFT